MLAPCISFVPALSIHEQPHLLHRLNAQDVHVMSQQHVEVRRLNGDTVCVIDNVSLEWRGEDLKQVVSEHSAVCLCKIELTGRSLFFVNLLMQKLIFGDFLMQK